MMDVVFDTIIDSVKLLPFLFLTYLAMEYLEHKTSARTKKFVKDSGKAGPVIGALLGAVPQCGFSTAASNLYAGKVITMGTLIAIFMSTSDEMIPVFLSEQVPQPLAADVVGDALVEHLRDILAPPDAPADLGRGKILQRRVFQHHDAAGEPVHPFAAAGIDVYRVFEDAVVLFPAVEPFYLVGAHEDRELHIRAVVLGQVAQRVDRIRRLGQQKFDDRGFYPVGIARRRAGRLCHFEPIHLG